MTALRGLAAAALVLAACAPEPPPARGAGGSAPRFRFVDVAVEAGIDRVVHSGRPDKDHLLDSAGTGAAWLDYDRDGILDAYVVNGWKLDRATVVERGRNALYRGRGDRTFEDATERAGVDGQGRWGSGVAVADYDGDGWPDLLVTNFGANALYRNRGDGTFEDVAVRAGVDAPGWNTGAAFLDADRDGDLDLYVATYIEATERDVLEARPTLDWKGVDVVAMGPFGLEGARDRFFRNRGDGTFEDATEEAGLADRGRGFGFGVVASDLDRDGDVDLYVANDSDANYQYRNDGAGHFTEIGAWSGSAYDAGGAAQAGMGLAAGDANGDGHFDLVVTNFAEDFTTLYLGDGAGFFEDASEASGIGPLTFTALSWGTVLADLDRDGDLDLVIANGHIYPQVDRHPHLGMRYAQTDMLLENDGAGRFTDRSGEAGPGFAEARPSRGIAAGDYDDDGDLDLLITHLDGPPALLRNESQARSWIGIVLRAQPGQGPTIGTLVTVTVGGRTQLREARSGESFLSAHDPRLLFGLGEATLVERIDVRWPEGTVTTLADVQANRYVEVVKEARE